LNEHSSKQKKKSCAKKKDDEKETEPEKRAHGINNHFDFRQDKTLN
jgi:hypothetical protein